MKMKYELDNRHFPALDNFARLTSLQIGPDNEDKDTVCLRYLQQANG
jgi:hypothetical protein